MVASRSLATYALPVALTLASPLHPRSDGCGVQHHTGFNNDTNTHQVQSGGMTRTYGINVPSDYNDNTSKRWPLIVDYHGNHGTSWSQYDNSQYYANSEGKEYLVVYPQGVNNSWQGPTYAIKGVDDLQFTTDLLAHLRLAYCIDDSRIYASGKSNGGGFVDTLACSDNGDEFAAFAMASAALYTDLSESNCTKQRAILESHGIADSTIPYVPHKDGGGGPLPDVGKWVSWWGQRDCGSYAKAVNSTDLGGYNTTTYSCGNYQNVVEHYRVFDLGHCWPDAQSDNYDAEEPDQAKKMCLDKVLNFTQVVVDFFGRWTLSSAPSN